MWTVHLSRKKNPYEYHRLPTGINSIAQWQRLLKIIHSSSLHTFFVNAFSKLVKYNFKGKK